MVKENDKSNNVFRKYTPTIMFKFKGGYQP